MPSGNLSRYTNKEQQSTVLFNDICIPMDTILSQILDDKRNMLETEVKPHVTIRDFQQRPLYSRPTLSLRSALTRSDHGIISEFKRKSPSKGWIHADADPLEVIPAYDRNGAAAVSILTDTPYFGGEPSFIEEVRPHVHCPILRKEFIIDELQIHEAKAIGADAILLIASALPVDTLRRFILLAHEISLEVLLEVHNLEELNATLNLGADVYGVNNRNLRTFVTDVSVSEVLARHFTEETVHISESGISHPDTVIHLRKLGYRGFLMGENFMKQNHPGEALQQFISQLRK